jgi:AcrR family transcriptional regulator
MTQQTQVKRLPVRALHPSLPANSIPSGTKGRILTSALSSFATLGFYGTSIRTIADAAGINSATLYSHFPSKETILAELVSIGSHELLRRITAALAEVEAPGKRLDAIIGATVRAHAEYPLLAIVTNKEMAALGPELAGPATAPTLEAAALLRRILADGVASRAFDLPDPEIAAHILEGMAQQIPQWVDPNHDAPEHLVQEYVRTARRIVSDPHGNAGAQS